MRSSPLIRMESGFSIAKKALKIISEQKERILFIQKKSNNIYH